MKSQQDSVKDNFRSPKNTSPATSRHALLIVVWYTSSIISAKLNYTQLRYLGSALHLSLFQQTFVSIAGTIVLLTTRSTTPLSNVLSKPKPGVDFPSITSLATAMTLMSISYNSAMLYIPVSFLNTIKATIPLWTSVVCWLTQKERFSFLTQLSLIAIVGGVGLASMAELGFHPIGFALGIFSAWNQTFFNIRAKSILSQDNVSPMQLQVFISGISAILLSAICLFSSAVIHYPGNESESDASSTSTRNTQFVLLTLSGLNYFAEVRLSLAVIGVLGSLGYSIADVFRRLIVICSAVIVFGNPIKPTNIVGVCIAMLGILLYNLSVAKPSSTVQVVPDWAQKKKLDLPPIDSLYSTPTVLFAV